jgi:molybdopterin converting factor small subunit
MHVRVELWMWLGGELGEDFQSPSEMCSIKEMEIEEGLTVIQLFDRLAVQYPVIEEKLFDRGRKQFRPNLSVIVTLNGQVISPFNIEENVLKDGCKITVLPYYAGG